MPTHNLNAAQAYVVAIWPFLLGASTLYLLGLILWAWVQVLAEGK